jgi:hypothetical protein
MFHLLAYDQLTTSADVNTDMAAVNDPIFSQRNNHFIFSEQYNCIGLAGMGASATSFRLSMPSVNAISLFHIYPINVAITPSSYPRMMDFRNNPWSVPVNEEMAFQETDTGAERASVLVWIAPDGQWNRNLPPSSPTNRRIVLQFTATVTRVAHAWSGPYAITFEQTPRGGWYVVNAAYVTSANARAFRLYFPRAQEVNGRILRPGDFVNNAAGNLIEPYWANGLGEWGRFHTFEPPQIEEYADAAGSDSITGCLDVTYLGSTPNY